MTWSVYYSSIWRKYMMIQIRIESIIISIMLWNKLTSLSMSFTLSLWSYSIISITMIALWWMIFRIKSIITCKIFYQFVLKILSHSLIIIIIIIINSYILMISIKSTHEKLYVICVKWTEFSEIENHSLFIQLLHAVKTIRLRLCIKFVHIDCMLKNECYNQISNETYLYMMLTTNLLFSYSRI